MLAAARYSRSPPHEREYVLRFPSSPAASIAFAAAFALLTGGAVAAAPGWAGFGNDAWHSGISATAAQSMKGVRWSTPVDLTPPGAGFILVHYGSPVITPANTVIVPVKTGASDGFRLDARKGGDGSLLWTAATDYVLPPHGWTPSYQPALAGGRVWFPGAGGTVLHRDALDAAVPAHSGRVAFYGTRAYQDNPASFDTKVFVNTPITAAASGAIYLGFRTVAGAPLGLASGVARIDVAGNGSWVAASTLSGAPAAAVVPHQAAPALAPDGSTLYVAVTGSTGQSAYLVGLDPATLAVREASPGVPMRVLLKDPRDGGVNNALVSENSSAAPMVGPDGDVFYGVLGNPFNGSRGWLLHYSADLQQTKIPGGFGWDNTAAVVPASAVPMYTGNSPYLVFSKYNDYAGFDGGTGVNRIALLDPNDTMTEPHLSSNGALVMRLVQAVAGLTPDPSYVNSYPDAVLEWCINAAAIDPATKSVIANSEDGKAYRWDLTTNTLSEAVVLSAGVGEAYTSTQIGPDGTVYATNRAVLNAVGSTVLIAVERGGSGSGSVVSRTAGIDCGETCIAQFERGAPVTLTAKPAAGSIFTGWLGACTGLAPCVLATQVNSAVSATFAPHSIAPAGIDIDHDGAHRATDGLLVLRYLFGLTGSALANGTLGRKAARSDPGALLAYLNDIRPVLDVDGDGQVDALTDGLLLIRYLSGVRGDALVAGTIAAGARRRTSAAIETYLESLLQ